jgi:antitoxin component YwqK of YwqJK toxin-antitoxin module
LPIQKSHYKAGHADGVMEVYARGKCVLQQNYSEGVAAGACKTYDAAGLVSTLLNYSGGDIDGPATFYFEGRLIRESLYKKGQLHGVSSDFDRDGKCVQTACYQNNLLDGPLVRYWPNGKIMEELIYKGGVPQGLPQRFDLKGKEVEPEQGTASILRRLETMVRGQ